MLFVIPLSSILYDPFEYGHISLDPISSAKLIFCLLIGISFFIILLFVLKRYKKMWFFLIPYLFFAAFSAKVYFYMHHQAIVVLFLIFIAWVTVEDKNKLNSRNSNNYNKTLKEIGLLGIYLCLFVSIYWSVTASVNDIKYPYSWARETAKFLKDYNLEHHHILSAYNPPFKENGKMVFNTNEINSAEIYPYFEDNIISNFYIRPYLLHQRGNWKDEYEKLRKRKMPDIILNGGFDIASIYGIQAPQHYILARLHPVNRIWKAKRYQMAFPVYMEEKIYKEKILKQ